MLKVRLHQAPTCVLKVLPDCSLEDSVGVKLAIGSQFNSGSNSSGKNGGDLS